MTNKQITKLLPEHTARFPEWIDKWTKVGLCCEPMDFEKSAEAVNNIYDILKLPRPQKILPAASPLAAVRLGVYEDAKITDSNPNLQPRDIPNSVYVNGVNQLYGGSVYAGSASFITFFRDVMGWQHPSLEQFKWGELLICNCGWVYWGNHVAVISDRPLHIKKDQSNRLHCSNDLAIKFRDGYGTAIWHGTWVPNEWILDTENMDPMLAINWPNIEERRCAAEIIGWAKVLEKLNCRIIDENPDPQIGTLLEVDIPNVGKELFLKVLCGTGRTFALPIEPGIKTAVAAQARTWNMSVKEFLKIKPEVRT